MLVMNDKPLLAVLGPKTGIPTLAAAWLQRWALLLATYWYEIEFLPIREHANANSLSHFPLGCGLSPETGCEFTAY